MAPQILFHISSPAVLIDQRNGSMKKKIVVEVSMDDQKSRSKALKISVCVSGVESAALKGETVEVIGEGIDAVELTRQLRKKMSRAELVSVNDVKKPETAPPKVVALEPQMPQFLIYPPPYGFSSGYPDMMRGPSYYDPACTIL
ncbi:heavy metal-associated isoprenylated plant protein 41-like isoform X2 [Andrographis paniculata]|uniref:heavy metal-associated isoprenylated plant protein 41-like isoform X2 n=1 Tax=Andrographis paniculata TaxID=175694 RepID=UPI0021E90A96|nr:heavy metal-associated isoprenylated plant protein 41-like isoform X2 [Andrographis paniculata]